MMALSAAVQVLADYMVCSQQISCNVYQLGNVYQLLVAPCSKWYYLLVWKESVAVCLRRERMR